MLIPVRCFTCGKVVGNKWERYTKQLSDGIKQEDVLTNLGLKRSCCRSMLMTHVELAPKLILQTAIAQNETKIFTQNQNRAEQLADLEKKGLDHMDLD
jgi:DNA-directed RNA polymerase I, II, and III subunit RPABC5